MSVVALADEPRSDDLVPPVRVSRYSVLNSGITQAQENLLENIVSVSISADSTTVGTAINEVLIGSGFRLAELKNSDPYVDVLFQSPLPDIHRDLGPAKVKDLLSVLAGPAWQLITDPVNRLVTFDLRERYWPCGYDGGSESQC